jgi:hypothetical protein
MALLELHAHTYFSEDCLMRPAAIVRVCQQRGVDRLAVTDHNTMRGAWAVREIAPELVIPGEEIMTTQGELLGYFMREEIPAGLTPAETIARLRAQGAAISVSHPFDRYRSGAWREADLAAIIDQVDAIEVFNARCYVAADNARALAFAQARGKPGAVGSDAHSYGELGRAALCLPAPPQTAAELIAGFTSGERRARRSSPFIHFTSTFARHYKRLTRWRAPA